MQDKLLDRGFCFIIVLWGERFCNYFLEYCLPSLLSPGNIPALQTAGPSKFLIATRPEDWERMRATAIFKAMERYITPVFIEIPPCPAGRSGCEHMGIGHKLACEYAYREKAYALVVTPDSMLSDGSIAKLQDLARTGIRLVLAVALRFGEEPFLGQLKNQRLIPAQSRRETGEPLVISGRQMAKAAINGLHRETIAYGWDQPYFVIVPAAAWWQVPGEDGIVIHSLSWAPLLIDYAAVASHDTSTFDNWTLDGDYIARNLDWRTATHIVEDSDEIFLASWAPMAEGPTTQKPWRLLKNQILRDAIHGAQLRRVYNSYISDPMKREVFFRSVRWHDGATNQKWTEVERDILSKLLRYLKPPNGVGGLATQRLSLFESARRLVLSLFVGVWLGVFDPLCQLWIYRMSAARRFSQILQGDRFALSRVSWHLRWSLHHLIGRPFNEHPPRPPA
jgi:hypothetical protein